MRRTRPARERFDEKWIPEPNSGCWLWTGSMGGHGYGKFGMNGRPMNAHRAGYLIYRGEIPEGLHVDHLCRVRACVNPSHMEAVTCRENLLRSPINVSGVNAAKTHCVNGHEFNETNTKWTSKGARDCRVCHRDRERKRSRLISAYRVRPLRVVTDAQREARRQNVKVCQAARMAALSARTGGHRAYK